MKTLKFALALFAFVLFTSSDIQAQVWHVDVVVSFDGYDMTSFCPEVGIITGTYTYRYAIKLSETGKIQGIHWVIQDCDMHNQNGDKVICIDNGHDNFGIIWDFFNRPDYYNQDIGIQYSTDEGWLDDYMPLLSEMPVEGTFVALSFRTMVKGKRYDGLQAMVQIHMNAHGVITANVTKP